MKCELIRKVEITTKEKRNYPQFSDGWFPIGQVIEGPRCFRLVQMGNAKPLDDECRERAGMTPEKMDAAAYAQERLSKGIHPEDFDAYDRGEMIGYNPDGSWIPGPNFEFIDENEGNEDDDE